MNDGTATVTWRRPDICVADGLLCDTDLTLLSCIADSVLYDRQGVSGQTIRARERSLVNDPAVSELLWRSVAPIIDDVTSWCALVGPDDLEGPWLPTGCNPLTRFYRYQTGASFPAHVDEPWRPHQWARSILTMLVYLPAGGCEGGETVIDHEVVQVVDGRIVLFRHSLLHEGRPVERGAKVVARNDIVGNRK